MVQREIIRVLLEQYVLLLVLWCLSLPMCLRANSQEVEAKMRDGAWQCL